MRIRTILGSPGTGKTTKLVELCAQHIITADKNVAFVTHTRVAAAEMKSRIIDNRAKLGVNIKQLDKGRVFIGTVHSLCYRALGIKENSVMTEEIWKHFVKVIGVDLKNASSLDSFNMADVVMFSHLIKTDMTSCVRLFGGQDVHSLAKVAQAYENFKEEYHYIDFNDMLIKAYDTVPPSEEYDVCLVDEAQDLSRSQWLFLFMYFINVKHFIVAGDDDQSIYRFQGAYTDMFLRLKGDIEPLPINYRSSKAVHNFSQNLVERIPNRYKKDVRVKEGCKEGFITYISELEEMTISPELSYLFMAPTNNSLDMYADFLIFRGCEFLFSGEPYVSNRVVRDVLEFDWWSTRWRNGYKRELLPVEVLRYSKYMEDPRGKAGMPWQDCFEFSFIKKMYIDGIKANMGEKRPHCEIGTIHSMKGRECDVVVITPDLYGIFATDYKLEKNPLDFARLFYVAVTRASLGVYILFPKAPVFYEELMGWNI